MKIKYLVFDSPIPGVSIKFRKFDDGSILVEMTEPGWFRDREIRRGLSEKEAKKLVRFIEKRK